MKLEDLGRLGPELDPCPISELFKFADGFFECGIDPFDLHFDVGRLDSAMRHPLLGLTEAKDASEHDAGRNGDAANHFHRRRGVRVLVPTLESRSQVIGLGCRIAGIRTGQAPCRAHPW